MSAARNASPDDTIVLAGSNGAITDANGDRLNDIVHRRRPEERTGGRIQRQRRRDCLRQQYGVAGEHGDQWYSWTGSGWSAGNDPVPAMTASPNDTVVRAGSTAAITDAAGNLWTISSTNAVLENGKAAAFTANVAEIAYVSNTVWQENTSNQWYSWTGSGWSAGADPLPVHNPHTDADPHSDANPHTNADPHSDANPDRVAQRHRRARWLDRRDHRCRRQPLDDIVHQRRPGEREGGRLHRQRRRNCLRQQYGVAGEHEPPMVQLDRVRMECRR